MLSRIREWYCFLYMDLQSMNLSPKLFLHTTYPVDYLHVFIQ
jgi:hypothetical protein